MKIIKIIIKLQNMFIPYPMLVSVRNHDEIYKNDNLILIKS